MEHRRWVMLNDDCRMCRSTGYRQLAITFSRDRKWGMYVHLHVCNTPPITCVICIAAWSLNTHRIWSLSAKPFLSYSLAANFDTPHAARATCEGHSPNKPNRLLETFTTLIYHSAKPACKSDSYSCRYKPFKSVAPPCRQAAYIQICPLFNPRLTGVFP